MLHYFHSTLKPMYRYVIQFSSFNIIRITNLFSLALLYNNVMRLQKQFRHYFCVLLQLFDDAVLLVDPTHEEETVCQGQITVITSGGDSICSVSKHGGASLNPEQLTLCISKAKQRWCDISKLMTSNHLQQCVSDSSFQVGGRCHKSYVNIVTCGSRYL